MALIHKLLLYLSLFFSIALFMVGFFRPVSLDYDLGRHLLFGRLMFESHHVINTNLLSYTNTNFSYINSHWLSEIVFYIINKYLGVNGLIIFTTIISVLGLYILSKFVLKRIPLSAFAFTLPIFAIFWILRTDVRPEIFSYLFIAIFIVSLFKFREKYTNLIYLLIPLEAIWVNLHINFAVGPALIFLFFLEELILNRFKLNKKTKILSLVLILSSLATFLNPNFVIGALNPLSFFKNYGYPIEENQSFYVLIKHFNYLSLFPHLFFIVSLLLLAAFYRKKTYLVEWFLIVIFSLGAFLAIRNFHVLLYISFYTYARLMGLFFKDITKILVKNVNKNQILFLKSLSYFLLCLIIAVSILRLVFLKEAGFGKIEKGDKALNFFEAQNLHGPIYNSFDFGQYISYRLYPREKVFVDGRPEAYPSSFFKNILIPSQSDPNFFNKIDKKYNFNVVFIYHNIQAEEPQLLFHLINTDKYRLVYLDDYVMIFVKNNENNKDLIRKFAVTQKSFHLQGNESLKAIVEYIILFDKIGWVDHEKKAYEYLYKRDTSVCLLRQRLQKNSRKYQELKNIKNLPTTKCYL